MIPQLLDLYANDPDPGIYGAVCWTLRQWGQEAKLGLERQVATGNAEGNRRWYVNRQGQTLAIITPPGEFVIGSPPTEVGREGGPEGEIEMQRFVRIDHAFAVMSYQVSVACTLSFARISLSQDLLTRTRLPREQCDLVRFDCLLQLAEREGGIPQEQWCYLPNDQGEYAEGL